MCQNNTLDLIKENKYKLSIPDLVLLTGYTQNSIARQVKQLIKFGFIDYIAVEREYSNGGQRYIKKYGAI